MIGKPADGFLQIFRRYHAVFHHIKALIPKPEKFFFAGIFKIRLCCGYQGKGKKVYAALCGYLVV